MSADMLVQSQEIYQVDLVGPARKDQKWQALAGEGYAAADFQIDWINQQATCPKGIRLNPGSKQQEMASPACLSSSRVSVACLAPFATSVRA